MNSITPQKSPYTPSFQAYYKSSLGKQLERALKTKTEQAELSDKFMKILEQKACPDDKIGKGAYGTVFRIDDYFVMKVNNDTPTQAGIFKQSKNNKFKTLKNYYGNVLARVGNIQILPNVTRNRKNFLQMANPTSDGIESYNKALREFAALPQQAFDKLAEDFKLLNEIHETNLFYRFDINNPNNFIKVGKSIRIVDEIDWVPCAQPNDIHSLMHIFIKDGGDVELKKEIFKKCAMACEKHKLPMDAAYDYLTQFMDDIIKQAGIKIDFETYYETMQALRTNYPDERERLYLVKKFIESL